jgi:hypothetical protein
LVITYFFNYHSYSEKELYLHSLFWSIKSKSKSTYYSLDFFNEIINFILKKNINTVSTNQIEIYSKHFNFINKTQESFEKTFFTRKTSTKKSGFENINLLNSFELKITENKVKRLSPHKEKFYKDVLPNKIFEYNLFGYKK